ncbi:ABC transporter ATP-binding protein [Bradyrhizobium sp. U87765 SZCCT0131]|uniref:ABC transporter ATP-binding protein n=1 Tax=unclassified Bradyrhizobium TaxID=2631580 RepID=UPI001BA77EC2|nr:MULTISPECIES: ABC transporter ATP-binding protein [unclassified Bradyrhizobium]MBR1217722.1 ABC transporter ATP-binding protein [Bradyrhizobium sp. U87765 SZCCT0131]MBR1261332.1 ABC transporter ATP-binding protein [Bradyrhizobium sp. U87765 SZCCT0134]MBR1303220.1 ABC transporter ATP-binding protein [Bradyrhizobium sp. U87765 SZCCT0110]MBR1318826.1 ABC transporter ATP-binding protein [Bradyrhizobium sp. U87765 SZCCT0109]MBR1347151.1 ABC transporter ATP-binding protein [Bradyrhizobium sp. U87
MTNTARVEIRDLVVHRAGKAVLHGVSLDIAPGEVTALVGANGAGKSSLVGAIAGALPVTTGHIIFDGQRIDGRPPDTVRRAGIAVVPEGHRILASLTVRDNLRAAGSMHTTAILADEIERALALFPELKARLDIAGGALSGGQKQMVSMSQALIARPRFLLIDELSLGLAPAIVKRLAETLPRITAGGTGILLIEQFTTLALSLSRQAYVLERGRIVFSGSAATLQDNPDILHSAYLAGGKRLAEAETS